MHQASSTTPLTYLYGDHVSSTAYATQQNGTFVWGAGGWTLTLASIQEFGTDGDNRLTNKSYSGACGATTAPVSYGYDDITNSNKGSNGAFVTQWEYDTADQVISITYPDNEYVTFGYLPQMLVNAVGGGAYVHSTLYDAARSIIMPAINGSLCVTVALCAGCWAITWVARLLTSSETTNMFDLRMVGFAMGVGEFVSALVGNRWMSLCLLLVLRYAR